MTTPTELLRQAREALAYLLPLAEMQPADVEPGRHLMRGDCPDETQPSSRDAECPACKKMVAADELIAAIDALPSAPAWPCHCDERGIGKPGVTCGDCPRDYGHTVDSAPSGEPAPTRADLIAALTFYATCGHMNLSDESAWDTVSGEPQNWWCDEAGTATIEDGSLARMALAGDMNADHFAALERGDDVCIDPGTGREAPQAAPVPAPSDWRRTVGAMASTLDHCARNAPETLLSATMREVSARLNLLLVTPAPTAQAAPAPQAEPIGYMSPQQVPAIRDPQGDFASLLWRRFRAHGIATPAPKEQK